MSHFSTLVIVSRDSSNPEAAAQALLEPYRDKYWDWYKLGGRWAGDLSGYDADDQDVEWDTPPKDIVNVKNLPSEYLPFAIITEDGKWYAKGIMGPYSQVGNENYYWETKFRRIIGKQNPESIVLLYDLHGGYIVEGVNYSQIPPTVLFKPEVMKCLIYPGLDASLHPVDLNFIHNVLIPHLLGETNIEYLDQHAIRVFRVRWLANAWASGLMQLKHTGQEKKIEDEKYPQLLEDYDTRLQLWGRPFLIESKDMYEITTTIDQYLASNENDVLPIIMENISKIDPQLTDMVQPNNEFTVLSAEQIIVHFRSGLQVFQPIFQARRAGNSDCELNGRKLSVSKALESISVAYELMHTSSYFRPGWMAAGPYYPSHIVAKAGIGNPGFLEPPYKIIEPLLTECPELSSNIQTQLEDYESVGAFIRAENVSAARAFFTQHQEKIIEWGRKSYPVHNGYIEMQKLQEALYDAEARRLPLIEVASIFNPNYSIIC